MAMIELSPPLRETLKRLGELELDALNIFIRGFKELLKECEEEILNFEIKYGVSFEKFRDMSEKGDLGDPFSYPLERDTMRWEDLIVEKELRLNVIRELGQLK